VDRAFKQHYADSTNYAFPPPGTMLEVAYFGEPSANVGQFERENCDAYLMAWLLRLQQVVNDSAELAAFVKAAQTITMSYNQRAMNTDKMAAVYQLKEHEESAADILGHSVVGRARELTALQDMHRAARV
jgi:hypothetical protein